LLHRHRELRDRARGSAARRLRDARDARGSRLPMSFVYRETPAPPTPLRAATLSAYREDETVVVERLLVAADFAPDALDRIAERARRLVVEVRRQRLGKGGLDAFLHEYALSSKEGIVLMCLAEPLLRIPDADTVDRLIRDKLGPADWSQHLGQSESLF